MVRLIAYAGAPMEVVGIGAGQIYTPLATIVLECLTCLLGKSYNLVDALTDITLT